ncbi:MAG: hypothetical protein ACI9LM_004504 [Alteromonadaceae bacterium]|jgi:hypothetical protein
MKNIKLNVNKIVLGPTLAKNDNDGKYQTIDVGDCSVGAVGHGAGAVCPIGEGWELSTSCGKHFCGAEISKSFYQC